MTPFSTRLDGNTSFTGILFSVLISTLALVFMAGGAFGAITAVTVTAPNGGEKWSGTQSITWTSDCEAGEKVNIYLGKDGTIGFPTTSSAIALNQECSSLSYSWNTVTKPDAADYQIKIESKDYPTGIFDYSDNFFTVDNHAPTTTRSESGTKPGEWYTTPVQVTLSCTDTGPAGCANTYYILDGGSPQTYSTSFTISTDGTHTLNYWSVDQAGNTESQKSATIKVDTTPPTTSINVSMPQYGSSPVYVKSNTPFTPTADDNTGGSGVELMQYRIDSGDWATYSPSFTLSGQSQGSHTIYYRSTDYAGNVETERSLPVYLDDAGPSVTDLTITPSYVSGDTYVSGTSTITASVSDGSGSDVAGCEYTVNGGSSWDAASYSGTCTASEVNTASASSIDMRATDNLGNTGEGTAVAVTPDTTPPATTDDSDTAWHAGDQNITLTPNDGSGSGVASTHYCVYDYGESACTPTIPGTSAPVTCAADSVCQQVVRYYSSDNIGNAEAIQESNAVKIDKKSPDVEAAEAPETWLVAKSGVTASYTCDDSSGSGCDASSIRFKTYDNYPECSATYADYTNSAAITSHKWVCAAIKDSTGNEAFSLSAVEFRVSTTIQGAIDAAPSESTIKIAAETYTETLNLGGKSLTIEGSATDDVIVDASSLTGYAIKNFGDSSVIRDLTLKGTTDNYGFKVSGADNITLENIKVENSYKTGIDLNGVNDATLNNTEVVNTTNGLGINMVDSNNITLTDITTSGNAWGGVSVQTEGYYHPGGSDNIIFSGTFDSDAPLLLEQDPCRANGGAGGCTEGKYSPITGVQVPDKFEYIVYDFREKKNPSTIENYKQWYYFETLDNAKTFTQAILGTTTYTYKDVVIYDIAEDNYYVFEGMKIQDAIYAASGSNTINVDSGTYDEGITAIVKDLTIIGEVSDKPVIKPTEDTGTANAIGPTGRGWFQITGATVNFENLVFDGTGKLIHTAVHYHGDSIGGTVENCDFMNIAHTPSGYQARGINNYGQHVEVLDCTFNNIYRIGVFTYNPGAETLIEGCTYTGKGTGDYLDYAFEAGNGATITVEDNTITNCEGIASTDGSTSAGILVTTYYGEGTSAVIQGNEIHDNTEGVAVGYDEYDSSTVTINGGNEIYNNERGIATSQSSSISLAVNENKIYSNSEYGIYATDGPDVNATYNWWGHSSGPSGEGLGEGDAVSANVGYIPWYINEDMTILSSSVDLLSVYVDDGYTASSCGDSADYVWNLNCFDTVQEGIDAVYTGGTVNVAAGTYEEIVTIAKSLTLRGATYGVNKNGYAVPTGYSWDENKESIIQTSSDETIVKITADGVTLEGFVIQALGRSSSGDRHLLEVQADGHGKDLENINIVNNVIGPNTNLADQDGTKGRMNLYIALNQYQETPWGLTGSLISGNKIFGSEGNGNAVFIWGAYYNYSSINPSPMTGTVIENNEICCGHRSGIEIAGGVSDLIIRNNDVHDFSSLTTDSNPTLLKYGSGIVLIRGSSDRKTCDGLSPEDLIIENNKIYDNEKSAIYMGPKNNGITINNNDLHDNGWDAIRLDLIGNYWNPDFEDSPGPYTCLYGSNNVSSQFNKIYDNGEYGIRIIGEPTNGFVLDATYNLWGDATGPGNAATNPRGLGDNASDNIDFYPWWLDEVGNLDISAPSTSIDSPDEGSWYNVNFDVVLTDSDIGLSGLYYCQYMVESHNGSSWTETTTWTDRDCTGPVTINVETFDCTHQGLNSCRVSARAADKAGNTGGSVTRTFSIDYTAPTITFVILDDDVVQEGTTIQITSDGTDPQGLKSCWAYLYQGESQITGSAQPLSYTGGNECDGTYAVPTGLDDETYNVRVMPKNNADVTSSSDATLTIDDTPPEVTASSFSVEVLEPTTISATINDANNVNATLYYSIGGVDQTPMSKTESPWNWNIGSQTSSTTITYYILAVDEAGNEETSDIYTITVYDFILDLAEEWNLISVPNTLADKNTESVFPDFEVWKYLPEETDPWVEPSTIDPGIGYWIYNTEEAMNVGVNYQLCEGGYCIPSEEIPLSSGWNLIGHMCDVEKDIDTVFPQSLYDYLLILRYDSEDDDFETYAPFDEESQDFEELEPGKGYWLFVTSSNDGDLYYTNVCG